MTRYLGSHVSIAGGFEKCIDRITAMGGNCLMTFASSPRSLSNVILKTENIKQYLENKNGLGPHFFHAPYLVKLAHKDPNYIKRSIEVLVSYQKFNAEIAGAGTIFHIDNGDPKLFAQGIDEVILQENNVPLILENSVNSSLEHLA